MVFSRSRHIQTKASVEAEEKIETNLHVRYTHSIKNSADRGVKRKKQKLKAALIGLSLKLELHEGMRFNVSKGTDVVINVLRASSKSHHPGVKRALRDVIGELSLQQRLFFQEKGIRF